MKPKENIDFNYLAIRPYETLNDKDVERIMERIKSVRKGQKQEAPSSFNLAPWLVGAAVILPSLLV